MNELNQKLTNDEPIFGLNLLSNSPEMIEGLGETELDYIWIDMEHSGYSPYDSKSIAELVRSAEIGGLEVLVRVPKCDPKMVNKIIDTGVNTVLIPKIETPEDVEKALDGAYFSRENKVGNRGAPLARSSNWQPLDSDFHEQADENVLTGVMIETVEAVENIEEILSIPEIGFAFIGKGDLSISLGKPFNTDHPAVKETVSTVEEAAKAAEVPLGITATSRTAIDDAVGEGYRAIRIGVDSFILSDAVEERIGR